MNIQHHPHGLRRLWSALGFDGSGPMFSCLPALDMQMWELLSFAFEEHLKDIRRSIRRCFFFRCGGGYRSLLLPNCFERFFFCISQYKFFLSSVFVFFIWYVMLHFLFFRAVLPTFAICNKLYSLANISFGQKLFKSKE